MKTFVSASAILAWALCSCGGAIDDIRARPTPASTLFDPAELVDVLAPHRIPAIDRPLFESAAKASGWLGPREPVVVVEVAGEARAYPLAILLWHEIVNDVVGGRPVAVTYSPLSNAAVVFSSVVEGAADTFGVSGKLYRSGLVMFDRRTKSLWPQLRAGAVAGPRDGAVLARIPAQISSFDAFREAFPTGVSLSRETGVVRAYGANPYPRYDVRAEPHGSFFAVRVDRRLPAMARVVGIGEGRDARAVPYARVADAGGVVYDRVAGREVVVLWSPGTRSALDAPLISEGRDVGSAGVFSPVLDGTRLDLAGTENGFRDRLTGSTWSVLGVATAGPLAGKRLTPISHVDAFWFAWAAFRPATTVFGG